MIFSILESYDRNTKIFSFVFGSNENFIICFWDLLTFSTGTWKLFIRKIRQSFLIFHEKLCWTTHLPYIFIHLVDNTFQNALRGLIFGFSLKRAVSIFGMKASAYFGLVMNVFLIKSWVFLKQSCQSFTKRICWPRQV